MNKTVQPFDFRHSPSKVQTHRSIHSLLWNPVHTRMHRQTDSLGRSGNLLHTVRGTDQWRRLRYVGRRRSSVVLSTFCGSSQPDAYSSLVYWSLSSSSWSRHDHNVCEDGQHQPVCYRRRRQRPLSATAATYCCPCPLSV